MHFIVRLQIHGWGEGLNRRRLRPGRRGPYPFDDHRGQTLIIDEQWELDDHALDFDLLSQEQKKDEALRVWVVFQDAIATIVQQRKREQCLQATKLEVKLSFNVDFDAELLDEQHFRHFYSVLQQAFPKVKSLELFGYSLPGDKKDLLIGDYFSNLEELRVINYDYPLTFQIIGSRMKNLHTLIIGDILHHRYSVEKSKVLSILTPNACTQLVDCILDLPTLKKVIMIGWKISGDNPRDCLGQLVCALACRRPNLTLKMSRNGWFHQNSELETPVPTRCGIPKDMWNALKKKRPIPFDLLKGTFRFDVMMMMTKQHYGLPQALQDTTDGQQPMLDPWVNALIELQRFERLDTFHAMFQLVPPMDWLSSMHGSNDYLQMSLLRCISLDGTKTVTLQDHVIELSQHAIGNTEEGKAEVISIVKDDFDQVIGHVKSVEEKHHHLVERVESLEEEKHHTRGYINSLEEKNHQLDGRVEFLDERVESLEEEKHQTRGYIEFIEEKHHQLVEHYTRNYVESVEEKHHQLIERVESLEEEKHRTRGYVETVEEKHHQLVERIESSEKKIHHQAGRIDFLEKAMFGFAIALVAILLVLMYLLLWIYQNIMVQPVNKN